MTSIPLETKTEIIPAWADKALSVREVSGVSGLSVSSIWSLSKKQQFPSPFKLSENRTAWSLREVQQWLDERKQSARVTA